MNGLQNAGFVGDGNFFRTLLTLKFIASFHVESLVYNQTGFKNHIRDFIFPLSVHFGFEAYLTPYLVCNLGPYSSGKESGGRKLTAQQYLVLTVNLELFLRAPIWQDVQSEGQLYRYVNLRTEWPLHQHHSDILCSWVRASWISVNNCPTRCDYTYLLTPVSRVLLEKLTSKLCRYQEIPRIYGTRKFLTVRTSARHPSLS